jgi:hypothetical protein
VCGSGRRARDEATRFIKALGLPSSRWRKIRGLRNDEVLGRMGAGSEKTLRAPFAPVEVNPSRRILCACPTTRLYLYRGCGAGCGVGCSVGCSVGGGAGGDVGGGVVGGGFEKLSPSRRHGLFPRNISRAPF